MKLIQNFFFLLVLLSAGGQSHAQLTLGEDFAHQDIRRIASYLRADSSLQLSQIQYLPNWTAQTRTAPLQSDQSLWMRFEVNYPLTRDGRFSLSIASPGLDEVDVYVLDDMGRIVRSFLTGADRPLAQRPINHRHFVLPLEIQPQQSLQVYIKIKDAGPMMFPVDLWQNRTLIAYEQINIAFIGVIGGALTILACYFLITYVLLRSPIRFWFAVASGTLFLLLMTIQGITGQMLDVGSVHSSAITCILALIIFSAAKVAHSMLEGVPAYWRTVSYVLSGCLIVIALILDSYWQIVTSVALAGGAVMLQLLLALLFHNRTNSLPNRVYALGWLIISGSALLDVSVYLAGIDLGAYASLILIFLIMAGVLLIAVAIEAHEQVLLDDQRRQQTDVIENLRQFYELFRNSAEGLYTSTMEGKLITTNPAMCALFGYADEKQMLEEVKNTSAFYAHQEDREVLLGQIFDQGMVLGKEIKGVRRDGGEFWFSISAQIQEEDGQKYLFGSIFDITEKKQSSISLEYLATHDSLTGVYNRREFERRLRKALDRALKQNTELTLLYMDLDQFKVVNDTCGHKAGDVLIKQLSQQLNDVVMSKGTLARLGGDEFGVLLQGDNAELAYLLGNKLLNVVQEFRFIWDNRIFTLGVSIGLVPWTKQVTSPEQLLSMADAACYMAKEQGRNQIHTYSPQDKNMQRYESELVWVTHINNALEDDRFELYYQHYHPLTKVAEGHHYEILLRLRDEEDNIVPPSSFLPAAERYNLTAQVDKWVIEHYFRWLADNPEHRDALIRGNINLSGHSLADKELRLYVLNAFEKYNIPYEKICFEITESQAIVKMDETLQFIKTFHQLGCTFALDDFGSGFSSYGYLKNLPVNFVKIDGSFVKDMLVDNIDMAMVSSIKDIAKAMGMETVAEFVESKAIMIELGKMGVDYAQGYGVAKPAPLTQFATYTV